MNIKSLINLGVVIFVFMLVFLTFRNRVAPKNKTVNNSTVITAKCNGLFCNGYPSLNRELEDKIILRIRYSYCQACIETMLTELNENTALNKNNFVIITQYKTQKDVKIFMQYTNHNVLNIKNNITPIDTIVKSHVYFLKINASNEYQLLEYKKGLDYYSFIKI